MKKLKLTLKRLKFKYDVRRVTRSRKVKSLNTLVVTHADRQIGKTTYLVKLINKKSKEENGILVVSTLNQKKAVQSNFPGVKVYTALELMRERRHYSRMELVLYVDETVTQTEVEALMPYYTIRVYLKYQHVNK